MSTKSATYWIDEAKRAYADGDDRALPCIDWLLERELRHEQIESFNLPSWLFSYWLDHGCREDAAKGAT